MYQKVSLCICSDANDLARAAKSVCQYGDLIIISSTSQLYWVNNQGAAIPVTGPAPTRVGQNTDNTGGTKSTTLAAIAAGASYTQADATAIKNGLASVQQQINALELVIHNAGITT
jgi:hypothetical protein